MTAVELSPVVSSASTPPRLGFLGVGWIGRHRMEALLQSGLVQVAAIADPSSDVAQEAAKLAPDAHLTTSLEALLDLDLDGLVIATPSALHAEQAIAALNAGLAVFCQKPLGRSAEEAAAVVAAARRADRLLAVDLSYRHTEGMRAIRELVQAGQLGHVFSADLVFHNAYGPDKPWFYDRRLSGGGCLMDLGVHLVDLALWTLGFPKVVAIEGHLLAGGRPLQDPGAVEDYALATLTLEGGVVVRIACSWRLPAGQDAAISATFYGDKGAAEFRNVGGSFYDFTAEHWQGVRREALVSPPDAWGGRAAVAWASRLACDPSFDASADELVTVAQVLDRIYGRAP